MDPCRLSRATSALLAFRSRCRYSPWITASAALALACSEGVEEPLGGPSEGGASFGMDRPDEVADGGEGGEDEAPPPPEVSLAVDDTGGHAVDEVGLRGRWSSAAGPGSTIALGYEDGAACLRGETAQVVDEDYGTYWGAEATFTLCASAEGDARPVSDCLIPAALEAFVGVGITLEGSTPPWLMILGFEEVGRESPASIWYQSEVETVALFADARDPFDSSAPAVVPANVTAVTLRVAGSTDGAEPFAVCVRDLRALFGEQWAEAQVPDWLHEPGPGQTNDYVGLNLVGAEFGESNLPGSYGSDYIYPSAADVELYAGRGMNVFRVPLRWERLQRELYAELDETELGRLEAVIDAAAAEGATVIVDPHNFARYDPDSTDDVEPELIGDAIPIAAFADFWGKVARQFAGDGLVWFGLMNEPHTMETEVWLEAANAALAAIRAEGADNLVLVPGNQWTGAHAWFEDYYGTPNATVMTGVVDPAQNFAFELHQYLDPGYAGTGSTCISATIGSEVVAPVTDWLREGGYRGFLGEFGGSEDPLCLAAMDDLLTHLGANADVWLGWALWASSQWNLQNNVHPTPDGEDPLQLRVAMRHLTAP